MHPPCGPSPLLRQVAAFHDAVERSTWRGLAFTPDSEHVIAGAISSDKNLHAVFIWNRVVGNLVKILEGGHGR